MPDAAPTPTLLAGPVADPQRIRSLDVLRGCAVLGIFVMNIRNFALPLQQFDNPAFPGTPGSTPRSADLWAWALGNLVVEDKMIAIFSMLFGAGIVVYAGRIGQGLRAAMLHYRRMFWLLVIGLVHAFGLWYGDILNTYAICGAVLYPARRIRAPVLVGLGIAVLTVAVWARVGPRVWATFDPPKETAARAVESPARPTPIESTSDRIWRESITNEKQAYEGSYFDLARWRANLNIVWHWYGCIDFNFWRCGGFMLIGMGLVRVLSASKPASLYWGLVIGGFSAGLALTAVGFWPQLTRALGRAPQMSPEARQMLGSGAWTLRYFGAACLAMGHVGLIMLLCRAGARSRVLSPLAAVGRMALTNYLVQTLIAVVVFDGWSLGNWGTWGMAKAETLVVSVWLVQLILSPIWLCHFRFGPAEWVWRSLTYWRIQPLKRVATL